MYDQRLFNQETGQQAGAGADDAYNLYDKPLFTDRSDVYRGRASNREGEDPGVDTSRFKPSKGFSGATSRRVRLSSLKRRATVERQTRSGSMTS